jgi:hypothetical protein
MRRLELWRHTSRSFTAWFRAAGIQSHLRGDPFVLVSKHGAAIMFWTEFKSLDTMPIEGQEPPMTCVCRQTGESPRERAEQAVPNPAMMQFLPTYAQPHATGIGDLLNGKPLVRMGAGFSDAKTRGSCLPTCSSSCARKRSHTSRYSA